MAAQVGSADKTPAAPQESHKLPCARAKGIKQESIEGADLTQMCESIEEMLQVCRGRFF